jgi:hypothetical protein
MFAGQTKKTVEFPDGSVTIHKLSWRSLEKARQARAVEQANGLRNIGGDILKALRSEAVEDLTKQLKQKQSSEDERRLARYADYDLGQVLYAAIESWTYGELNQAQIDQLPQDMAEKLAHEALDLSLPPLDPAKAEAEGKDDSVPSMYS